jgi:diguanylate cyclase (GGDEF)-like protein
MTAATLFRPRVGAGAPAAPEFDALLEALPSGIAWFDEGHACRFGNAALAALIGRPREALVGRTPSEMFLGAGPILEIGVAAALRGHRQVLETPLDTGDDATLVRATFAPLRTRDGAPGALIHLMDVTDFHRRERELDAARRRAEEDAASDPLTGLPNRRLLDDGLARAIASASRSGQPLAVMSIDIDDFKSVNDAHGHAVGDLVLQATAHRLGRALRAGDTVFRTGGDEFVALLPALSTPAEAAELAARVIHTVAQPLAIGGVRDGVVTPGVSVGIAHWSSRDGGDALLAAADRAMYAAKASGRRRFAEAA